jgi:uncharacterized protein (TIGR03435 family)
MLQKLLVERFKLQIHRESKLQPGYALGRGAGEPKLTPSPPLPAEGSNLTPAGQVRFTRDKNGFLVFPPGYANVIGPADSDGITRLTATRQNIKGLTAYISMRLQQPLIDETGLEGIFDYHLAFASDSVFHNSRETNPVVETRDPAPTLVQAVERQLGLKLEPRKLPVDVIVIDHVERVPVEN